jgi:hypothetical protein
VNEVHGYLFADAVATLCGVRGYLNEAHRDWVVDAFVTPYDAPETVDDSDGDCGVHAVAKPCGCPHSSPETSTSSRRGGRNPTTSP